MTTHNQSLRRALGMFATGITIITTCDAEGRPIGLTVNSFNSVSLEPPLIVWSLSKHLAVREIFERCEYFAVNVLAVDQESISRRFARREADFHDLDWKPGVGGVPLLEGCCASFEVRNAVRHEGGDHIMFIGEVVHHARHEHEPLVYFGGKYRHLGPSGT